ncbi:DMT family transporter [Paludifilum halophilum]|uniref:EamA domain-containing protein n=1 Tax=Paludifilum halophilum TaxID=1642702 RepID=A0A235B3Q4_9BACL|nr:EamA family transporter [Paludifilum halophilum]OYD06930.1 hypothetical protein CHM34_13395 [Paludifilum halophilum]
MRQGWLWVCLGAVLWGTAGMAAKILTGEYGMDALGVAAWRLLLSLPLLLPAAVAEARGRGPQGSVKRTHWRWFFLFGAAVAGYQASFFTSVEMTRVSTATLLTICTAPILVAVIARTVLREPQEKRTWLAMSLGLIGVALLVGVDSLAGLAVGRYVWGNGWALVAAACYGGYVVIGKRLLEEVSPFRVTGYAFAVGAVLMLPALEWPEPSWTAWMLLLYLGFIPTGFAYLLYIRGLEQTTATRASIAALLEPLTASVLAVIFLGERLTVWGWLGGGMLLFSLTWLSIPGRHREKQAVSNP